MILGKFMKLTEIQSKGTHFIDLGRINDDSIIVDAGALWGIFEENLRTFPQAKQCRIIILECDRGLRQLLEDKHLYNVTVIEKALCGQLSSPEKQFFQVIGLPGWGSFFNRRLSPGAKRKCKGFLNYPVKTIRINDIFSELGIKKIDYFKVDIMGAEREVVETMSQETASKIKQIDIKFFELISGMRRKKGNQRLINLGFKTEFTAQRQLFAWRE